MTQQTLSRALVLFASITPDRSFIFLRFHSYTQRKTAGLMKCVKKSN